ncbi:BtrH N-terminal domain-containing protein [Paenibacillus glacialis]|uniref:Lantibiotic ABC transporter n=1 Tax=Paenibacillus glacialis TaxID=494026 RepID=A0A168MI14_9BACL|nr:BtrH N-terminal domain-containing protein [Paenibacillus glacialis]OAB44708.1 lantibiotic ABC transporter [Paenibacillus glacialis]
MIIDRFVPFTGEHCETTAIGNLLVHSGIRLSEPMLFGIGEGLGFIYWDMKGMDFPFIGGRVKPDELTACITSRLNLTLTKQETASVTKAWRNIKENIDHGIPVGLKLDCYHLDYFTNKVHFAAHYVAMYGYDDEYAYMADTSQQGGRVKTRLETLVLARNEKGPMSSKNLSYAIEKTTVLPQLVPIIRASISSNAYHYLNPPIRNIGIKGIEKMSSEILKWPSRSQNLAHDLCLTALLMERGGTGGALFRNLYRDFLKESLEIFGDSKIERAYLAFMEIAPLWSEVSAYIDKAGRTGHWDWLKQASELLRHIARKEKEAMELLLQL